MIEIKKCGAQGDVRFDRVEKLPEGLVRREGNIVTHSETGHHHTAHGPELAIYDDPTSDGLIAYMVATGPIEVMHHRPTDTHETLRLLWDEPEVGEVIWQIRRQREYTPEGWRRVED